MNLQRIMIVLAACSTLSSAIASSKPNESQCENFADTYDTQLLEVSDLVTHYEVNASDRPRGWQKDISLVPHCEITGSLERHQVDSGEEFRIQFRVRLPDQWNGRYLFMGGGGSNGRVGSSIGHVGWDDDVALNRGYAVVSQDSGHDNERNNIPELGGIYSFGSHAQTRRNYAYSSLIKTYNATQHIIKNYYQNDPSYNYFYGCSKGGQEGIAFAEHYPLSFDGIVAGAPGMSLPKAALNQVWDTQQLANLLRQQERSVTVAGIADSLSPDTLEVVRQSVEEACDKDDGVRDGLLHAFEKCTTAKVVKQLELHLCKTAAEQNRCITKPQIQTLVNMLDAAPDYISFPWDTGFSDKGWARWKLGGKGQASRNIFLGGGSLPTVFSVPSTLAPDSNEAKLKWMLNFKFPGDTDSIYRANKDFERSAWSELNVRFADMGAFSKRGKLIVPHGNSDPVFSVNDTVAWWRELNFKFKGRADEFVRVFPVPGMGHCRGGPSPHKLNSFDSLVSWVENGASPDYLIGKTDEQSRWQGSEIPICRYPYYASKNKADEYICDLSYQ